MGQCQSCNIHVIVIPKEERDNEAEEIFEVIMNKNFVKLITDTKILMQQAK